MKNKRFLKKFLGSLVIVGSLLILNGGQARASLQANPNTQYTKTDVPVNWMKAFREMEQTGEAMGLDESLNADLTAVSSNNIDVHMMRSTEYGAIAILSASGYGNPSNEQAITSTTGNNTGVILDTNGKWEWVAGGLKGSIFTGTDGRYYDTYEETQTSAKRGDALGNKEIDNAGCDGWHSAQSIGWVYSNSPYFTRGGEGIFSGGYYATGATSGVVVWSRGVAVCGTSL